MLLNVNCHIVLLTSSTGASYIIYQIKNPHLYTPKLYTPWNRCLILQIKPSAPKYASSSNSKPPASSWLSYVSTSPVNPTTLQQQATLSSQTSWHSSSSCSNFQSKWPNSSSSNSNSSSCWGLPCRIRATYSSCCAYSSSNSSSSRPRKTCWGSYVGADKHLCSRGLVAVAVLCTVQARCLRKLATCFEPYSRAVSWHDTAWEVLLLHGGLGMHGA